MNSVLPVASKDKRPVQGNYTDTGSFAGTLRAQSSTTFRNYFPGTSHRETISCPWAIIVNNYEISGPSEQIRTGRTLYPQCSCIPFTSTVTKNIPRNRCHTEGPRKCRVAASAHQLLCVQISYDCVQFLC